MPTGSLSQTAADGGCLMETYVIAGALQVEIDPLPPLLTACSYQILAGRHGKPDPNAGLCAVNLPQ